MASKVAICNRALSELGASLIVSLTDNTTEAKLCNTFFDDLADEVMVEGMWSSTLIRTSLAQTATTPAFDYSYEYQLPVDPKCLLVVNINESTPGNNKYVIEGDKLLTDMSSVSIRYIARLTDPNSWDTLLRRAFTSRLISVLAFPLTGSKSRAELELQKYIALRDEGLALDGRQGSKDFVVTPDVTSDIR